MDKFKKQKFLTAVTGLWLLIGCGDLYIENSESNEQGVAANALAINNDANSTEATISQVTEAEDIQATDDIRGSIMAIANNTIEIREQISETIEIGGEEEDLAFDAPEEDGWLRITFDDTTVFEVIEFNAGGILNRSYGTTADLYLDDGVHAFGTQLEDEFVAEKIEIWVLIQ